MTPRGTRLPLVTGDVAPAIALPDHTGVTRTIDFAQGTTLLFFFPKADTPGCTLEARDFSDHVADFKKAGVTAIGISADPPRKLNRFREKQALRIMLLSDETHDALNAYGVWGEKSMYGRTFEGIVRSTFLIGRDRRLQAIWRSVKVPGHASAVLEAARGLC